MEEYLLQLNDSQRAAVTYCDGPQLVIAGAGSGKTRVLTMKIAYLLQHGYHPDEIIALTFTKKAATEMKDRISALVGPQLSRRLWMGTFHSLFSRILRKEAQLIGFKSDFTIYDQSDSRSLVKAIIKELELDEKVYKPNSIHCQISNAKNNLVTPGMYAANQEYRQFDNIAHRPMFSTIYQKYWSRCFQAGAMDFDDLLLYTNILFRDHPDVLEFYQNYFKYVLVDEYQDTNRAQHLIVEQLIQGHKHLCVVGDDAQSIYSFRGANIRNILNLRNSIPGTQLFKLEQNYRSTQNIVDAANSLISKNKEQIPKTVFSQKERGSLIAVRGNYSDLEEAYNVASGIASLYEDGYRYGDTAILYRTNAQSRSMEEALRKRGIPYRIYGGLSFYQRKEIKDIISYLRLITNTSDEEAFKRIINYPARGIGDTTVKKLAEVVSTGSCSFFDVCSHPEQYQVNINRGTAAKLAGFTSLIGHYIELNTQLNAYELTSRLLIESGIKSDLASDATVEGQSRRENVEELLSAMQTFVLNCKEEGIEDCHLTDFLADVSLSGDVEPATGDAPDNDVVTLMTIHAAKGLEFKNVFIVGVEENLLPSDMSYDEPGGVEEERRLFYVALTRAQENCFLSFATSRFRNGHSDCCRPSRFIKDIDPSYLNLGEMAARRPSNYGETLGGSFGSSGGFGSGSSFGSSSSFGSGNSHVHTASIAKPKNSVLDLTPGKVRKVAGSKDIPTATTLSYKGHSIAAGMRIAHDRFGQGIIKELNGSNDNARITVVFNSVGEKTLLLKFANFTILD